MKLIFPLFLTGLSVAATSMTAQAKMSVNDAQACQAVLDFTIERLESVDTYDKTVVATITKGLRSYESFLQSDHITPGLLKFTNGDPNAADEFQSQIDDYKAKLVDALKAKYPQDQIFTDQAVSINKCYTDAPMEDDALQMMTDAVQGIVALARQG